MRPFIQSLLFVLALAAVPFGAFAQAAAPAGSSAGVDHTLGPGDEIRVSVYQNPDLALETRLSERGEISFPLLGIVQVGGLTVGAAERKLEKLLRDGGFVLKPQVNISVAQIRSSQVSVLGQVSKPGRYPLDVANSKVSEIIAAAGGALPTAADVVTVVGKRDGKPVKYDIDLPAVLQGGRADQDVTVMNGDILYVDRAPMVYIYGEVQRPGAFRLERGMTLMQALAQGGGVTARGTERGIRINRRDTSGKLQVIEPKMNDEVQRDDVIFVRESIF